MSKDFTSRQQHLEEDFYGQYTTNKFNIHGRQPALKNSSFYSCSLVCNENTMVWKTPELSEEGSLNIQSDQMIHLTPTRPSTRTSQKKDGLETSPRRNFKRHDDFQDIQKRHISRPAQQQSLRNHNLILKEKEGQNLNQLQSGLVIRNLQKRSIFSNPILAESSKTELSPIRSASASHKSSPFQVKIPSMTLNSFLVKSPNNQQLITSSSPISFRSIQQLQNSLKNQCTPKKEQSSSKISQLSFYNGDSPIQKETRQLLFGSAKKSSINLSYESLQKSHNRKIRMSSCPPLEIPQIEQLENTPRIKTTTRSINSCFSEGNTRSEMKKIQLKNKGQSDFSTFGNTHQSVQINQFVFRYPSLKREIKQKEDLSTSISDSKDKKNYSLYL